VTRPHGAAFRPMKPKPKKLKSNLVQTVLTPQLADYVRRQAAKEGISVAAWVRRLIINEESS
jgi:hypothetical protein